MNAPLSPCQIYKKYFSRSFHDAYIDDDPTPVSCGQFVSAVHGITNINEQPDYGSYELPATLTAQIITDPDPEKSRVIIKGVILGFHSPTRGSLMIEKASSCSEIRTVQNPLADKHNPDSISAKSDEDGVMKVHIVKTFAELKQQTEFEELEDITDIWDRTLVFDIKDRGRVGCWVLRGLSPRPENIDTFADKLGKSEIDVCCP